MSAKIPENTYKLLRNFDSAYQAMTRVTDSPNTYDVVERFIKDGETNDFAEPLRLFDNNKGVMSDGKYFNFSNFFVKPSVIIENGQNVTVSHPIPYFKFKTNAILDYIGSKKNVAPSTVTKNEFFYKLITNVDQNGHVTYSYADKTLQTVVRSSEPLRRLDQLMISEMPSFFIYLNGKKLPDNEIFVYCSKYWTDILVPEKYIGDIRNPNYACDWTFTIDFRQVGAEDFYFRGERFTGDNVTIDLTQKDYAYKSIDKTVSIDKMVLFVDGKLERVKSVSYVEGTNNKHIRVNFEQRYQENEIELYILNDLVYRYHKPAESYLNKAGTKLHFFVNDDYWTDTLNGPITKNSLSFFYNGLRMDDSKIIQTSRFSWEYDVSQIVGFDEKNVDFFVEDINRHVEDNKMILWGDDYYLLNMLGVKRCVDRMKGGESFSVFDDPNYQISFRDVLSDMGKKFDVDKVVDYYNSIENEYSDNKELIKRLISDKPHLLRNFFEIFENPSKRMVVIGNKSDVVVSSPAKVDKNATMYYKIYVNHILIEPVHYTTKRSGDYDIITIKKEILEEFVNTKNPENLHYGMNEIEIFQFDVTYMERMVTKFQIDETWTEMTRSNGSKYYTKEFDLDDLPFSNAASNELIAIEPVEKKWFSKSEPEYWLHYPSKENKGFIQAKWLNVSIDRINEKFRVDITLNHKDLNKGVFYLMIKTFSIAKTIQVDNTDGSYFWEEDLAYPIYGTYYIYDRDPTTGGKYVKETIDYIPYISDSEPVITRNGKELIYGKEYTYVTPEKSDAIACSYIVLKAHPNHNDLLNVQFSSSKTNVIIVGYDNLNIDNKYGLVYLSELKYPVSPDYMNIYINGEKVSKYDVDILSDKLIRVHDIYRPINTILVTTNLTMKDSELNEFIDLYKESEFEKLLERLFQNCDPSKEYNPMAMSVDYIYKMIETDEGFDANHGFIEDVDSVKQIENPLKIQEITGFNPDTIKILYVNWLNRSRRTKVFAIPDEDIDPFVLQWFSIYLNTIIDKRIDIVVDPSIVYDGMYPDLPNELFKWDKDNKPHVQYPGSMMLHRRMWYFAMLKDIVKNQMTADPTKVEPIDIDINAAIAMALNEHEGSRVLYPCDYPIQPDEDGIIWSGTTENVILNDESIYE